MNKSITDFCDKVVAPELIAEKEVLEIGSRNVNGSLQGYLKGLHPARYVGIDASEGPGVDVVVKAEDLLSRFAPGSFDFVLSNECVEHVEDWQKVFSNIKRLLRPGGCLLITTRSKGFGYHAWPHDFWRYELSDMRAILSDLQILNLETDCEAPGVFVFARKPADFQEKDLSDYALYSIVKWKRLPRLSLAEVSSWDVRRNLILYSGPVVALRKLLPASVKLALKRVLFRG